jgi:gamma-glutamyltranspeptidase
MKIYEDSRGWQYSVRPGLGGDTFSVFYRKPGKSWHSVRAVPWYGTAAEADMALDDYAAKHKMRKVAQ